MEKTYVPKCNAKEIKFQDGGSMLKLSFRVEELVAFAQKNKNEKGYLNLNISLRKTPGQYGDTHSVSLDTWKPKTKDEVPF